MEAIDEEDDSDEEEPSDTATEQSASDPGLSGRMSQVLKPKSFK